MKLIATNQSKKEKIPSKQSNVTTQGTKKRKMKAN